MIAGLADDVTLERPSEAFDLKFDAVSFVFEAALEAASCVEACLLGACRLMSRVCRSIKRGVTAVDIGKAAAEVNRAWSRQGEVDRLLEQGLSPRWWK